MIGASALAAGLAAAMQLSAVTVEVSVESHQAVIDAQYRFARQTDSLRFVLIKLDGQSVRMLSADEPMRERAGLFELLVGGTASPLRLRYAVDGGVERLPVFVPDIPAAGGRGGVEIRLAGATGASLADGFPRFERDSLGLVARLDNVPSSIRLPRNVGWSTDRTADALVIVLLVLGTTVWMVRNRPRGTARRAPSP